MDQTTKSSLAMNIERCADRYLEIKKQMFGFSLRKLIPIPGILQAINFTEIAEEEKEIQVELGTLIDRIQNLQGNLGQSPDGDKDKWFLNFALLFCLSLNTALGLLEEITLKLEGKAKGIAYAHADYKGDLDAFETQDKITGQAYDDMAATYQGH